MGRVLRLPLLLLLDTVLLLRVHGAITVGSPSATTSDPLQLEPDGTESSSTHSNRPSATSACVLGSGASTPSTSTSTSSHQRAPTSPTQSWQPQIVPDWITASEAEALSTGAHAREVLNTAGAAATAKGLTASLYLRENHHCKDELLRRLASRAATTVGVSVAFVEPAVLTR